MFVTNHRHRAGYNRSGEQVAHGYFMMWVQKSHFDKDGKYVTGPMYAAVRKVALVQCGHWMIGSFRVGGKNIAVSGALGSDGLPKSFSPPRCPGDKLGNEDGMSQEWLDKWFVKVPQPVVDVWEKSEGHNTCNEPAVRDWGLSLYRATYLIGVVPSTRRKKLNEAKNMTENWGKVAVTP